MLYAKCPYCNVTLDEDDCTDIEDEGERLVKRMVGHCRDCRREFQWKEIFNYIEASDPVEIM